VRETAKHVGCVIEPKPRSRSKLKCVHCDMEYSHSEYKTLKALKKLLYFSYVYSENPQDIKSKKDYITVKPVCHYCLTKIASKYTTEDEFKIAIIVDKKDDFANELVFNKKD